MRTTAVITNYNYSDNLIGAIQSVIKQVDKVVVVDDCSHDNSIQLIRGLSDTEKLMLFRTQTNLGQAACKNIGIESTINDTDIYVFLDADDIHYASMVKECLKHFPKAGLVYTDYEEFDLDYSMSRVVYKEPFSLERLLQTDIIGGNFLVSSEVFKKCGQFNAGLRIGDNYEFVGRVAKHFRIIHVPEVLSICAIGHRSLRRRIPQKEWDKCKNLASLYQPPV